MTGIRLAGALRAKRFLLLTDVPGVLDKSKNLIKELSVNDARRLIADGTISGGMIPKLEESFDVLSGGAQSVVIVGKLGEGDLVRAVLQPGSAGTVLVAD